MTPPKIGTVVLRPTLPGTISYAQNVEMENDEYGHAVVLPGPALVTIGSNSELTGVPIARQPYALPSSNIGYIWFVEGRPDGTNGARNILRRVKDVEAGETPSIDTTGAITIDHSAHANEVIDDIVSVVTSGGDQKMVIVGKDDTDQFLMHFTPAGSASQTNITTFTSTSTYEHKMIFASDNAIYGSRCPTEYNGNIIWRLANDLSTFTATALDLPVGLGTTALAEWQNGRMAIAVHTAGPYTFSMRKGGGKSLIFKWNFYANDPSYEGSPVSCPSRYISAMVNDPGGDLIVFGGVDKGRSTLWLYTGYGVRKILSYIGDLPRSNHSIDFDEEGRINWLTADGQWLRYDRTTGVFSHLATVTTSGSAGGILTRAVGGSVGNDFILASGASTTYTMKRVVFGSYIGDGDSADGVTTPLVISEPAKFNTRVKINHIELIMRGGLVADDNLELRLYKNGNSTAIAYGADINSTNDGIVVSSVRREQAEVDVSMAHVGVAFKATDARATSPGVIEAIIDYDEMEN